jgi:hypothetical protein
MSYEDTQVDSNPTQILCELGEGLTRVDSISQQPFHAASVFSGASSDEPIPELFGPKNSMDDEKKELVLRLGANDIVPFYEGDADTVADRVVEVRRWLEDAVSYLSESRTKPSEEAQTFVRALGADPGAPDKDVPLVVARLTDLGIEDSAICEEIIKQLARSDWTASTADAAHGNFQVRVTVE